MSDEYRCPTHHSSLKSRHARGGCDGGVAQLALKLPANVPGDFFVDSTCIDCDACRVFAPSVFSDEGDQSTVYHQPETDEERLAAEKALISCPTASIGMASRHDMRAAVAGLPELVDAGVYRCG